MSTYKHLIYIITLTIIPIFLSCGEHKPVKIGVVLPLSGDYEAFGKMGLDGARAAAAEINENGGVLNGRPVELIVYDNQTDPNLSIRHTRQLIMEDNVTAILGPVSSISRNAIHEICKKFRTPLLYGIDYEGGIIDRYLFCYSPVPNQMIHPLVPFMAEQYGNSFYVFGYDYIWPHKISESIKKEVESIGGTISGIEFTPFGVKDFTDTIERIRASGAKNLILAMPGLDGYTFIHQYNDSGLKKTVHMAAIASDEAYLKHLPTEDLDGIITCLHFLNTLDKEETHSFVKRMKDILGPDATITFSTESHYGLMMFLKEAIEKSGSLDKEMIIDAMENIDLVAGNGKVTMREDHHTSLNMIIAEFRNGALEAVKDIGLVEPDHKELIALPASRKQF